MAIIATILVVQWAGFNKYILDNPGQFAQVHSGAERTADITLMVIMIVVFVGGFFLLGLIAAIAIPAYLASQGFVPPQ
jgi:hypothetical protein